MSQAAWVPDEAVTACHHCKQKFSLLVRKHHCRSCGQVFCSTCSSRRARLPTSTYNPSSAELVRVCDSCYQLCHRRTPAKTTVDESKEILLYNTHSVCPKCAILERRGFDLQPASVIEFRSSIYLRLICSRHSHTPLISLICSNSQFYHRMINFCHDDIMVKGIYQYHRQPRLPQLPPKQLLSDIEDLHRVFALGQNSQGLPLSMDITLFRDDQFLTDEEVNAQLMTFAKVLPRGQQIVIKLIGGLVEKHDISELNRRILRIVSMVRPTTQSAPFEFIRGCPLLIDLSFERMIDLSTIQDSALLLGRVYPCVRYFLTRGDESQFLYEMSQLTSTLTSITDMQLVLLLSVDQPYPDMTPIMEFIQKSVGLIRFVVISRERSPKEIFARLARVPRRDSESDFVDDDTPSQPTSNFSDVENIDPYELISTIETATQHRIKPIDWIPFRAGHILEPLFSLLGYGNYHFRPSPMCAMATLMINTPSYPYIPISRLLDMQRLYTTMEPISERLKKEKMGLWTKAAVQKALQQSAMKHITLPDVFSYATSSDPEMQKAVAQFVKNLQLIVIHNKMDFSTVDAIRRCHCATVTPSPIDSSIPVAACTGCI